MRFIIAFLLMMVLHLQEAMGQDTLPKFSAVQKSNGKIIISWHNKYPIVNQISVQRSKDSLKNFTTILTVPDASLPENGFVESKTAGPDQYYRLFILLNNSKYLFTTSSRAIQEVNAPVTKNEQKEEDNILQKVANQRIFDLQDNSNRQKPAIVLPNKINEPPPIAVDKTIFVKEKDLVIRQLPGIKVSQFRDSILTKTKDTLLFVNADTILIKPFVPKEVYKVSSLVFTGKDGNVNIALLDANKKKYAVKFYDQDNAMLLEIKEIRDQLLIVDKTNFVHAGWYRFELFEEGKIKEKNRLFIPKDF